MRGGFFAEGPGFEQTGQQKIRPSSREPTSPPNPTSHLMHDLSALERYRPIIDDWDAFEDYMNRPLPHCVWANPLRCTPEELERWLVRCGLAEAIDPVSWMDGAWKVSGHDKSLGTLLPFLSGLCHIQEEVSLLPVHVLAPQPGERVLDTCAAPGGKTSQIAVRMRNKGTVVANDRSYQRMRALRGIIDRLGVLNVSMICHDASNLPRGVGQFDRILVDAPCSCEGTSRKQPKVLRKLEGFEFEKQARIQRAILQRALEVVKPGGFVAYSTCAWAPEENEGVVQNALDAFGWERAQVVELPELAGFQTTPGLLEWRGERFDASLERSIRVWPHHNDTGGFYVSLIQRTA